MKKIRALVFLLVNILLSADEIKHPFLYIPGMFDNGDLFTSEYNVVKTLNAKEGFYYKKYFSGKYNYDKST
jgi:hypothetical protein